MRSQETFRILMNLGQLHISLMLWQTKILLEVLS